MDYRRPRGFALAASGSAYSAPKTVLVVGDSLSAEYGLARGSGWVALLEQKLKAEKMDARIVNASISGDTTSGGRSRLPALLAAAQADVVVLELGANDGLRGLPVASAEDNLRAMINAGAAEQGQGAAGRHAHAAQLRPRLHRTLFGMYKELAGLKVPLVPFMLEGVAGAGQLPGRPPASAGSAHPVILNNIWPQLAPLIKQ
jgi:acyl-CoA thioesterase-1